ncbi:uncharacterized protein [Medicago truncatula]|uniref:uncharacterized protein n=1 Tax=Medicago truncatula TaxID=3880 RepID=UPI000D2F4355|nr:uncharacterized protein LOC112420873 [Medicago truncatula]
MSSVVAETQSAFVKNRQILDGILIANEVVDEARKDKKELMLFKVDFEKAYDSVDWGYLDSVMKGMSFPVLWRKWIRECVGTATAAVLVNGSPTDEFHFQRGLRQGDPLSPFLFLLAAEGLNVLMKAMVENNLFKGFLVGSGNQVEVTHLQFADDTLLLGEKSWANVRALHAVLILFESLSGLKVNFNKSLLVGINISDSWLFEAESVLSCWDTLCSKKKYGGLGVRRLKEFNIALLGKWCWRMLVDRVGLRYQVLVVRYGEVDGRLEVGGWSVSLWWREVGRIRDGAGDLGGGWFGDSVRRRVGDGTATLFWSHRWLEGSPFCVRFPRLFDLAENKTITVASLFYLGTEQEGEGWRWRRRLWAWEELLLEECRALLFDISLVPNVSDTWEWLPDTAERYSVPLKVSVFAWRLIRDRLPTKANLATRGVISANDIFCVSGCGHVETADHLFLSCNTFASLWQQVRDWMGILGVDPIIITDHLVQFIHLAGVGKAKRSFLQLIWLLCSWVLWSERNNRLFNKSVNLVPQLLDKRWWSDPFACLGLAS